MFRFSSFRDVFYVNDGRCEAPIHVVEKPDDFFPILFKKQKLLRFLENDLIGLADKLDAIEDYQDVRSSVYLGNLKAGGLLDEWIGTEEGTEGTEGTKEREKDLDEVDKDLVEKLKKDLEREIDVDLTDYFYNGKNDEEE
jgi:hypothetical protein